MLQTLVVFAVIGVIISTSVYKNQISTNLVLQQFFLSQQAVALSTQAQNTFEYHFYLVLNCCSDDF